MDSGLRRNDDAVIYQGYLKGDGSVA